MLPGEELSAAACTLQGSKEASAALAAGKAALQEQRYGFARSKLTTAMEMDTSLDGSIKAEVQSAAAAQHSAAQHSTPGAAEAAHA